MDRFFMLSLAPKPNSLASELQKKMRGIEGALNNAYNFCYTWNSKRPKG